MVGVTNSVNHTNSPYSYSFKSSKYSGNSSTVSFLLIVNKSIKLVYKYGFPTYYLFTKAHHIEQIVKDCWEGQQRMMILFPGNFQFLVQNAIKIN